MKQDQFAYLEELAKTEENKPFSVDAGTTFRSNVGNIEIKIPTITYEVAEKGGIGRLNSNSGCRRGLIGRPMGMFKPTISFSTIK